MDFLLITHKVSVFVAVKKRIVIQIIQSVLSDRHIQQPLCRVKGKKLQYGRAMGQDVCNVSLDDIYDCLTKIPARADYGDFCYNCWNWAAEAPSKCGLQQCSKKIKTEY
jgi:hypothetical protein